MGRKAFDDLADRILTGEVARREGLVHHSDSLGFPVVEIVELTAADEVDPHGLEVSR